MVTIEELKLLLHDFGYVSFLDRGEERWRSRFKKEDRIYDFKQACNEVLGRCFCCGEKGAGEPSAACFAQHEGKDCNCYRTSVEQQG